MGRRDKRARVTGRRGSLDEGAYGQIPDEVLLSEAGRAMPDYAIRVLLMLAAQFRGFNNGDLALTSRAAKSYGLADWKLRAGLRLLEHAGLVHTTRRGHICQGRGVPSLYALTFRDIAASQKYDRPTCIAQPAPNDWVRWAPPSNWEAIKADLRLGAQGNRKRAKWRMKNALPTRVTQDDPPEWIENGPCPPTRVRQKHQNSDPPGLVPSQISPRGLPSTDGIDLAPREDSVWRGGRAR